MPLQTQNIWRRDGYHGDNFLNQNPMITYEPAERIGQNLGGVIVRIKSHNARSNAQKIAPGMRGLLSVKWALWGRHGASDSFVLVSVEEAAKLQAQRSRWSRSISYPKRVPTDLGFRNGGIFG